MSTEKTTLARQSHVFFSTFRQSGQYGRILTELETITELRPASPAYSSKVHF